MRALSIWKTALAVISIVFVAAQAQAQTICSGAGIHQSCVTQSGNNYAYNGRNGKTTQVNSANVHNRWNQGTQKIGNAAHNSAAFGTQLATAHSTKVAKAYNNINNVNQGLQNAQQ